MLMIEETYDADKDRVIISTNMVLVEWCVVNCVSCIIS